MWHRFQTIIYLANDINSCVCFATKRNLSCGCDIVYVLYWKHSHFAAGIVRQSIYLYVRRLAIKRYETSYIKFSLEWIVLSEIITNDSFIFVGNPVHRSQNRQRVLHIRSTQCWYEKRSNPIDRHRMATA